MPIGDCRLADFFVSTARRDEATVVADLFRQVVSGCAYYNDWARGLEIAKHSAENLSALIDDDPDAILLARSDGDPVGFCISDCDSGLVWLSWMGVSPARRKHGIATALVTELIARAPRRGAHKIWCDSRMSNVESAKVLGRCGFRRICELRNHWCKQDFYLWERPISHDGRASPAGASPGQVGPSE